jgi:hypothetical protein
MSQFKTALIAAAIVGLVGSGMAYAQTTPAPAAPAAKSDTMKKSDTGKTSKPDSAMTKAKGAMSTAKKWTLKEWNKAKGKYAKEKVKWAACRKEAKDQKLKGRKSWSFLADCMTKK